jgi:rubredoxin
MTIVVAHDDVKANRRSRIHEDGIFVALTDFIVANPEQGITAQAMLVEEGPHRNLRTHYHDEDEFQIFTAGGGTNGKHPIKPFQLHFARKHTPYGPILASEAGCAFLTLRSRSDNGAKFMPESRARLDGVQDRHPWQIGADIKFPEVAEGGAMEPVAGVRDDYGLDAQALRLAPGARLLAPSPAGTDGQYLVVLRGSLIHEGAQRNAITIIFLQPGDAAFELQAGSSGLDALVLSLPRQGAATATAERAPDTEFKVWQCVLCAFVYDEAAGLVEEGIPPGTRWEDVPESFTCSDCGASKSDFVMAEL